MGRYIGVFMLLVVFITANALQYTHDVAHHDAAHYDCPSADHEHPQADECALCWFIFHQISAPFGFSSLLPPVAIQERISSLNEGYGSSCQDGIRCLLGNKDPPQYA